MLASRIPHSNNVSLVNTKAQQNFERTSRSRGGRTRPDKPVCVAGYGSRRVADYVCSLAKRGSHGSERGRRRGAGRWRISSVYLVERRAMTAHSSTASAPSRDHSANITFPLTSVGRTPAGCSLRSSVTPLPRSGAKRPFCQPPTYRVFPIASPPPFPNIGR